MRGWASPQKARGTGHPQCGCARGLKRQATRPCCVTILRGVSAMPKTQPYTTTLYSRELKWSGTEKLIARKAFDLALKREFNELLRQTKQRIAKAKEPADLWELEDFLSQRHREMA